MLTAQIGGAASRSSSLFSTKFKLKKAGFRVTHPLGDGFSLMQGRYFTFNPQKWSRYEVDTDYFASIAASDVHIVCNDSPITDGAIDPETALGILYAMMQHKPIVMTQKPKFGKTIDLLPREIITKRLNQLTILPLRNMQTLEVYQALPQVAGEVDYQLTEQEVQLIKSRLKEHFRFLLHPTRNRKTFFAAVR